MRKRGVKGSGSVLAAAGLCALLIAPAPGQATDGPCLGVPFHAEGSFSAHLEGAWVMIPVEVPDGCHRLEVTVDVRDQTPAPATPVPGVPVRHTLDLAVYEPTAMAGDLWGGAEFRGYGGSGETEVVITEGGETTRGFTPGPIPAGTWAVELGLASIASELEGDADGHVAWEVGVAWSSAADANPWVTAPYPSEPADPDPGWYAGDFHVHGPNSNDARTKTWGDLFATAFTDTGLDFIAVSDHNVTRQWQEIGAALGATYADKLVIRSAEITTYRGHVNAHSAGPGLDWVDYRTGPVYRLDGETLVEMRGPTPPGGGGGIFDQIHGPLPADRGWAQVNHPTTFPSPVPGFGNLCRGCPWEYSDDETDWAKVDAMEVSTGPAGTPAKLHGSQPFTTDGTLGPNPFTPLAIEWWDRLQRDGHDITAMASSDSHDLDHQELTQAPIGEGTTVVYAPELSEAGVAEGIRNGHAYLKLFGPDGPDLELTATPLLGGDEAMMGDELEAAAAVFSARVFNVDLPADRAGPLTAVVMRDGVPYLTAPVVDDAFRFAFVGVSPGDYRLQVMRGTAIEALTNPINLEPGVPGVGGVNRVHNIRGSKGKHHGTP